LEQTYIAVVGKARNITPAAMNAAVRMKEQTTVTMIGDLPLLLRVCGGITGNGDNRLDEANASQTAMVMRRLWYYYGHRPWPAIMVVVAAAGGGGNGIWREGHIFAVGVAGQTQTRFPSTDRYEEVFLHTSCSMLQIARHRPAPLSSHAIRCCKC